MKAMPSLTLLKTYNAQKHPQGQKMRKLLFSTFILASSLFAGQNITLTCNGLVPKSPNDSNKGKQLNSTITFTNDDKVKYSDNYGVRADIDLKDLGHRSFMDSTWDRNVVINDHTIIVQEIYQHNKFPLANQKLDIKINRLDGNADIWATYKQDGSQQGVDATFTGTCIKTVAPNAI
jgi:hypothetical protein